MRMRPGSGRDRANASGQRNPNRLALGVGQPISVRDEITLLIEQPRRFSTEDRRAMAERSWTEEPMRTIRLCGLLAATASVALSARAAGACTYNLGAGWTPT